MELERIKAYYNNGEGPWTKEMLDKLLQKGVITSSEYNAILSSKP